MAVVPLTLTISLCLVFTFVVFFLREHARGRLSSAERDSLLPLADDGDNVNMILSCSVIERFEEAETYWAHPGPGIVRY